MVYLDPTERSYTHVEEDAVQHRHGDELKQQHTGNYMLFCYRISLMQYASLISIKKLIGKQMFSQKTCM